MRPVDRFRSTVTILATVLIAAFVVASAPARAEESAAADPWTFGLAVYGWLPDIEGELNQPIPGSGDQIVIDAGTLLDNLQMTAQVAFEARHDRWMLLANVIYLSEEAERADSVSAPGIPGLDLDVDAQLDLSAWIAGLGGARVLAEGDHGTLSFLFGVRYFAMDSDLDLRIEGPLPPPLPSRSFSQDVELWDGIVGIRGRIRAGKHWFFPYHLDAGTGESDLTWQALAGFGYQFRWGSVSAAYRSLNYDQGGVKPVEKFTFSGPALAVRFRF